MLGAERLKQIVIDAFDQELFERDTAKDTDYLLGFIYDSESPFTVKLIETDDSLQIKSQIDLDTPLAKDKDAKLLVRDALKQAGLQVNLAIDNH